MKIRLPPGLVAVTGGSAISTLARTWRFSVGGDAAGRALGAGPGPFLFLLWHEVLLPLLWLHRHRGIAIVVSEAADGRYLAAYAARLGYQCLFGSSTRGGARALIGAIRALEGGTPVAFTPDGPRGPRREMKPGILAAAQRAGVPILPIHAQADRAWRLASWDRFVVPRPFARIRVGYGRPFPVAPNASLDEAAARAV
ncbi:MAG: lysophospholipid acyltransferase family protein, partial [Gemmatimonadales bacterium]